jgi:RNA polymerase sigma factor (sigma-70 family)
MSELLAAVRRCQAALPPAGKCEACDEVIRMISPKLHLYLCSRLEPAWVEDVHQEVLIGIATGLRGFRGTTEPEFWGWCYRIAHNKVCDAVSRKQQTKERFVTVDEEQLRRAIEVTAAGQALPQEEAAEVDEALCVLARLGEPCAGLLRLRYLVGLSLEAVGMAYALSPDAARMKVNRCLDRARELLEQKG